MYIVNINKLLAIKKAERSKAIKNENITLRDYVYGF